MAECDFKLVKDIEFDCTNMSEKGLQTTGYIMNYADVVKGKCNRTGNSITALALATGAKGYKIMVPEGSPFNGTTIEAAVGTYRTKWNKTVAFVILNSGPEVSHDIIDKLANGKFVVVLENKFAGAGSKNLFEVYGFEQGLKLTASTRDLNSDDTDGGWSVTLQEQQAPSSGLFLWDTDEDKTRKVLASLSGITPSVVPGG